MAKSALILGASGLVGGFCLDLLLANPNYTKLTIIVRNTLSVKSDHLKQQVCDDFSKLAELDALFEVDEVFCCVGTTIKKAQSQQAFLKVDLEIPKLAAQIAARKGVRCFSVISSVGANAKGNNFYLSTKGKMEEAVCAAPINSIHIFRPSLIIGSRKEMRIGERVAHLLMPLLSFFLIGGLKKYKPIHAKEIAQKMIQAAAVTETDGVLIYEYTDIKAHKQGTGANVH